MPGRPPAWRLGVILAVGVGLALWGTLLWQRVPDRQTVHRPTPPVQDHAAGTESQRPRGVASRAPGRARPVAATRGKPDPATARARETLAGDGDAMEFHQFLTPEKIEEVLALRNRRVDYLLAAALLSSDRELRLKYLTEAAAHDPTSPMVQALVIGCWLQSVGSTDPRLAAWIDAFKQSAPDNALAWAYGAYYQLKTGNTDAALAELGQAAGKGSFADYFVDKWDLLSAFDQDAGAPELDAEMGSFMTMELAHLSMLRELARTAVQEAGKFRDAGETDAALLLYRKVYQLGQTLQDAAARPLISDLVALAIQQIGLKAERELAIAAKDERLVAELDQIQAELQTRRSLIRAVAGASNTVYQGFDAPEILGYLDRVKRDGELNAMLSLPQVQAALRNPPPAAK